MRSSDSSRGLDSTVQARLDGLLSKVPPSSQLRLRQIAWSLSPRLPFFRQALDWDSRLRAELIGAVQANAIHWTGMDVDELLQILMMLIAKDGDSEVRDMLLAMSRTIPVREKFKVGSTRDFSARPAHRLPP